MTVPKINRLSSALKGMFGGRVTKVAIDQGASCPNRRGPRRSGGCVWCDPDGSGPGAGRAQVPIAEQVGSGAAAAISKGYKGVIPYFQAFTGTFGDAKALGANFRDAIACKGVVGLAIATRPDCLPPEMLGLLEDINRRTLLWVEIGMQTRWNCTLDRMGRGHGHKETVEAAADLRCRGIKTVLHLIFGLPGEDRGMMVESAREASRLSPWGLKFHPLHVVRGSGLELAWRRGELDLLGMEEYACLVADSIELLHPGTTIHRMTGERPGDMLLAPEWCREKGRVIAAVLGELERRGSWQGIKYSSP